MINPCKCSGNYSFNALNEQRQYSVSISPTSTCSTEIFPIGILGLQRGLDSLTLHFSVLTHYQTVTDGQTFRRRLRPRVAMSRGKKYSQIVKRKKDGEQ